MADLIFGISSFFFFFLPKRKGQSEIIEVQVQVEIYAIKPPTFGTSLQI